MSIATYARKKKAAIPSTISLLSTASFLTKAKDSSNKENIDAVINSKKPTRTRNTALQPKKTVVKKPVSPDEKPKKKKVTEVSNFDSRVNRGNIKYLSRQDRGLNKFLEEKSKAFAQVDEFQFVESEAEPAEAKKKQIEPEDLSIFKALRSVSESIRSNATIDSNMLDLDIEPLPAQFAPESPPHSIIEDDLPAPEQFFKSAPLASSQDEILPPTSTPGRMPPSAAQPKKNTTAKAPTQAKAATKASRAKKAAPAKKEPAKKAAGKFSNFCASFFC